MDIKINETTMEIQKTVEETKIVQYDIEFLYEQKKTIQEQKDRDNVQRDLELNEIDDLISRAEKLGITIK